MTEVGRLGSRSVGRFHPVSPPRCRRLVPTILLKKSDILFTQERPEGNGAVSEPFVFGQQHTQTGRCVFTEEHTGTLSPLRQATRWRCGVCGTSAETLPLGVNRLRTASATPYRIVAPLRRMYRPLQTSTARWERVGPFPSPTQTHVTVVAQSSTLSNSKMHFKMFFPTIQAAPLSSNVFKKLFFFRMKTRHCDSKRELCFCTLAR